MNKHAFIFPGQGSQYPGMGKNLYETNEKARQLFEAANSQLGFRLSDIMFDGTDEALKQTDVTQPAVFVHAVIAFSTADIAEPAMVAGHSLGEFSALVANRVLTFADALKLVSIRAAAMQKACSLQPSTMAAILGLADEKVEEICAEVHSATGEIVVPANYNCPGQVVISGTVSGVESACEKLKAAGAKRALVLQVGGAFHSPLMEPARQELAATIESLDFKAPLCAVYQNAVGKAVVDAAEIKHNLIEQLTAPVKWTQCVQAMIEDGATHFTESGPGKVLQGLVLKINKTVTTDGIGG